jgi:hypothetical protein
LEGITQKNGKPYKPTTQGKIERFWQTLKKYLTAHPAGTIDELQAVLDEFRNYYNQQRPHRALNRATPAFAYALIPKAEPTTPDDANLWRVRYDRIDPGGKVSLRYGNRMLHLGVGRAHARTEIIILIHNTEATSSALTAPSSATTQSTRNRATNPNEKTVEPRNRGFNRSQCVSSHGMCHQSHFDVTRQLTSQIKLLLLLVHMIAFATNVTAS